MGEDSAASALWAVAAACTACWARVKTQKNVSRLPIDDCSSVGGEGSLEQPPMRLDDLLVVIAEAVLQFGGPFDVREEQRDGAARQTRHRLRFVKGGSYFLQAATMSTP